MLLTKFYDLEDFNVLIFKCLENLKIYLDTQNYPKHIVDDICDQSFINDNPSYYLYYPYLFNSAFDFYDDDKLKKLAIAGFLYYKSIIYIDDIFDNKKVSNIFHKYTISNICQEETIKLLSSLFNINSNFWKIWNKRKFEYFKAYQLGNESHNIKSYKNYEILADYKSSFGKIAIDALFILSNEKYRDNYMKILDSHKFFYITFQILDDISDFEEDYQNNQFNISRFELEKKIKNLKEYRLKDQKKLLYTENITLKLHNKALIYLNKSLGLCDNLIIPKWKYELQSLYNTVITHRLNIYGFLKYSTIINNLKNKNIEQNTTIKAIKKAKIYISIKQEPNGCWEDYFNNAGISDVWTTAYVSYFLSKNNLLKTNLKKSKTFLLSNFKINYLLGYNTDWIPDADSTSFGILALNSLGYNFNNQELEKWYSYQNEDGGFSTYNSKLQLLASLNSKKIKDVKGWLNSHFCVSAVAYLVFSELKINNQYSEKLRNYLICNLKTNSYHPYWWNSSYYSLSFLIIASSIKNDVEMLSLSYELLNKYLDKKLLPTNEFYTALLIKSFCLTNNNSLYENSILSKLISKLLKTQKKDGSWDGNYSLRMPSPYVINPNLEVDVWDQNNKGTNIIVKDFHGLFTTASCLSALNNYVNLKL